MGVYNEIVINEAEKITAKQEVISSSWVTTIEVNNLLSVEILLNELDLGEAETIVLAQEIGADCIALTEDLPQKNLFKGQVGTVVEILAPEVFEVDFSDEDGQTYAMTSLRYSINGITLSRD